MDTKYIHIYIFIPKYIHIYIFFSLIEKSLKNKLKAGSLRIFL